MGRRSAVVCRCFSKKDAEAAELAFVRNMECLSSLNAMDEPMGCVDLR